MQFSMEFSQIGDFLRACNCGQYVNSIARFYAEAYDTTDYIREFNFVLNGFWLACNKLRRAWTIVRHEITDLKFEQPSVALEGVPYDVDMAKEKILDKIDKVYCDSLVRIIGNVSSDSHNIIKSGSLGILYLTKNETLTHPAEDFTFKMSGSTDIIDSNSLHCPVIIMDSALDVIHYVNDICRPRYLPIEFMDGLKEGDVLKFRQTVPIMKEWLRKGKELKSKYITENLFNSRILSRLTVIIDWELTVDHDNILRNIVSSKNILTFDETLDAIRRIQI